MTSAGVIYPPGNDWLSDDEMTILSALNRESGACTPARLAQITGRTWQHCARIAGVLVRLGLISRCSLPKQVSYEIAAEGRAVLGASTP